MKEMIQVRKAAMATTVVTTTTMMEMKQDLIVRVLPRRLTSSADKLEHSLLMLLAEVANLYIRGLRPFSEHLLCKF
jgi:aspartokinase-like uncharacterized kinase